MEPVLKWAGGKRQILNELHTVIPEGFLVDHTLYEPFVGGGSVFLSFAHNQVVINDSNKELINTYRQIKYHPYELIELLEGHEANHNKEYFYYIRNIERTPEYKKLSVLEKAARTIYLNRTCFNGLYRVNRDGFFNVPIGNYKNPQIVRKKQIMEMSSYLKSNHVVLRTGDFADSVYDAQPGDVVYCDPPYDYEDDGKEGFVRYTADQFSQSELVRLGKMCNELVEKGCHVIISNNDTELVRSVFSDDYYDFKNINGRRMINNTSQKRAGVKEVIIYGHKC